MDVHTAIAIVLSRLEAVETLSPSVLQAVKVLRTRPVGPLDDSETFPGVCEASPDMRHHVSPSLCRFCLRYD